MPNIPPIEEQWLEFFKAVLPNGCSPTQRREMRRAFFAGARSLYSAMMKGLDPESEPTEADMARMAEIEMEFKKFELDMKNGVA